MPTSDDRTFGPIGTRVLLDNDRVRVWELRLDPGDSSDLHHHALDYLMVQIEGDKVAARFEPDSEGTFAGAEYLEGPVSPGTAIFASAGGRETAINVGEQTFREIIVEVKADGDGGPPPGPPRLALGRTTTTPRWPSTPRCSASRSSPVPRWASPAAGSGPGTACRSTSSRMRSSSPPEGLISPSRPATWPARSSDCATRGCRGSRRVRAERWLPDLLRRSVRQPDRAQLPATGLRRAIHR